MKPGDLVTVNLSVAHAYLQGKLAEYQDQVFTIVEVVDDDGNALSELPSEETAYKMSVSSNSAEDTSWFNSDSKLTELLPRLKLNWTFFSFT